MMYQIDLFGARRRGDVGAGAICGMGHGVWWIVVQCCTPHCVDESQMME